MAKTVNTTEAPAKEKTERKRTVLSPEERIKKMEAELAAERAKVQAKAKAKLDAANDKVANLEKRKSDIEAKLAEAKAEAEALARTAGVATEDTETSES